MAMAQDNITVVEIFEYLRQNPQSGDTVEGIVKWWMMRQRLSETADTVHHALEQLVEAGAVFERRNADGRIVYFANH